MAYDVIQHDPAAVVEGLRSAGYSIAASVADIIDNSLSAQATCVEVEFHWAGCDSWISILDNGTGMEKEVLKQAMKLGSKNARDEREKHELGRFGMGLKTASWGVCKSLTVISKVNGGQANIARMDLDEVAEYNENRVHDTATDQGNHQLEWLQEMDSGTIVIWEKLDRLVGDIEVSSQLGWTKFLSDCAAVQKHLEMVFHRFLDNDKVVMHINRRELITSGLDSPSKLEPWDPFLEDNDWTYRLEPSTIHLPEGDVNIRPFVLPHYSRFTSTEAHEKAGGIKKWNSQQGFYVYRNSRMIGDANWFGTSTPDEHTKLARICIDIPNTMDNLWKLDFVKSKVVPPKEIYGHLETIGTATRKHAAEIYKSRSNVGNKTFTENTELLWRYKKQKLTGKVYWEINKNHPLVKHCRTLLSSKDRAKLDSLLKQIGATLPVPDALILQSDQPDSLGAPNEDHTSKENLLLSEKLVKIYIVEGWSQVEAIDAVCSEFFRGFPELQDLLRSKFK